MTGPPHIRSATLEDAPTLWQAEVATADQPGLLVSRPGEITLDQIESRIRTLASIGSYLVAVRDGVIHGHAYVEPMPLAAVAHVYRLTIVVHPGKTGSGTGTALLQHIQAWAQSNPTLRKVELLVRRSNSRAIRLYQQLGFVEEGILRERVRLVTGEYVDDLAMAWFPQRAS